MSPADATPDLAGIVKGELPYLRRYARALTGNQDTGDRYAMATLEALVEDRSIVDVSDPRVGLFRAFHVIWSSAGAPTGLADDSLETRAQDLMSGLTQNSREVLLLRTIEQFRFEQIATITGLEQAQVEELFLIAQREMARGITGKVLIIEDEPIISVDLQSIVTSMGHAVTAMARTREEAVREGIAAPPDLILADIKLADESSGIDAVHDLLGAFGQRPVIFITAFPERLLTGTKPEPAFLISKPYTEEQVSSAVSQAMFFASTETLTSS